MPINFETKTDRELLLLNVKQSNDLLKKMDAVCTALHDHDDRLQKLELFQTHQETVCDDRHQPLWRNPKEVVPLSLIVAIAAALGGNTEALLKFLGG